VTRRLHWTAVFLFLVLRSSGVQRLVASGPGLVPIVASSSRGR